MSIRDFLMGAQQLQSGAESFSNDIKSIRQQNALDTLQQQSPDIFKQIRTGTPEQQASAAAKYNQLSIQSGQKDNFANDIGKYVFNNKAEGQATPLTKDQIQNLYPDAPSSAVDSASQIKDIKAQQKALSDLGVSKRSSRNYGQSSEKITAGQGTKAFDVLNKSEDAFRDQDYKLKEIQQALQRGTSLDDNIAFGYIARSVAAEKGPLSDADIARIQGITGYQGALNEFKSRFTGDVYAKLSPQQKDNIKKVVANNAQNFSSKKAEALSYDLNGLYQAETRLKDKEGNPTGILKQRLDAYKKQGVPIDFDPKSKSFVVEKGSNTATGDMSDLLQSASTIKDPAIRAQFIGSLNKRVGQALTPDQVNQIKTKIQQAGGQ